MERTLDENGKIDKHATRHAPPGMVDLYKHDSSSRQKSHYWNKVTIKTLIRDIAGVWHPFVGQDAIVQLAQNKLERVYSIIHPADEDGDDVRKMWHSPCNVAAAVLGRCARNGDTMGPPLCHEPPTDSCPCVSTRQTTRPQHQRRHHQNHGALPQTLQRLGCVRPIFLSGIRNRCNSTPKRPPLNTRAWPSFARVRR